MVPGFITRVMACGTAHHPTSVREDIQKEELHHRDFHWLASTILLHIVLQEARGIVRQGECDATTLTQACVAALASIADTFGRDEPVANDSLDNGAAVVGTVAGFVLHSRVSIKVQVLPVVA